MEIVFSASRNLYPWLMVPVQSILAHDKDVRIWLMIEDDKLPYEIPEQCRVVNVSGQTIFPKDGPNSRSVFTYLAMIRAAYPLIFNGESYGGIPACEKLDKIVSLDCDIIAVDSLKAIWDVEFPNGEWFAAVAEYPDDSRVYGRENTYRNAGCMVMNFEQMRKDEVAKRAIELLNKKKFIFLDEQVLNLLNMAEGDTKCVDLHPRWNQTENSVTLTLDVGICHYAGYKDVWKQPPENVYRWHYLEPWLKYAKEAECAAAGIKF